LAPFCGRLVYRSRPCPLTLPKTIRRHSLPTVSVRPPVHKGLLTSLKERENSSALRQIEKVELSGNGEFVLPHQEAPPRGKNQERTKAITPIANSLRSGVPAD